MSGLALHPLCELFPPLADAEFNALRDDIAANGQRSPIVLFDGMILDGGNRYRACLAAGVEPNTEQFKGGDVLAFVLSANLHRRHLSAGQQATIVAAAQDWTKAQQPGGDGRNQHSEPPATLPDPPIVSVADRAALSGASERTQRMADKVARADPALARQVAHGTVSLPKAVERLAPRETRSATTQRRAPAPSAREAQAAALAEDAHGDADLVAELENAQKEIERLHAEVTAAEVIDTKAEVMKYRRLAANAERMQGEAMDRVLRAEKREKQTFAKLARCGKAVGESDPDRIPTAVETFVREHREAAA